MILLIVSVVCCPNYEVNLIFLYFIFTYLIVIFFSFLAESIDCHNLKCLAAKEQIN